MDHSLGIDVGHSGDGDASEEYYQAVFRISHGEFQLPALQAHLEAKERRSARYEAKIEELAKIGRDEGIKAKLDESRAKKAMLDAQCQERKRHLRQIQDEVKLCHDKLHIATHKQKDKNHEELYLRKHAIFRAARELDPEAAECAAALGRLAIRTPAFLVHAGFVDIEAPMASKRRAGEPVGDVLVKVPVCGPEVFSGNTWSVFSSIDSLAQDAENQDAEAISDLLAILTSDHIFPQGLGHLVRTVKDRIEIVERKDQMIVPADEFAAIALWPEVGHPAPNREAFRALETWMRRQEEVHEELSHRHSEDMGHAHTSPTTMARQSVAQLRKSSSMLGASPSTGSQAHQDVSFSHGQSREDFKLEINHKFRVEDQKEKGYLHLIPAVCEALLRICHRSIVELKTEEAALYGHRELGLKEQHWFYRRKAAARICELAASGNVVAQRMLIVKGKHVFFEDPHWMVQQLVVTEACHIIGRLDFDKDQEMFEAVVAIVVKTLYISVPNKRFERESSDKQQELKNVADAAEEAIMKELPVYSAAARDAFILQLRRECEVVQHKVGAAIRDRIVRACGQDKPRSGHGAIDSMKKMREYQAALQHDEDGTGY